jgi:hypothetical protein
MFMRAVPQQWEKIVGRSMGAHSRCVEESRLRGRPEAPWILSRDVITGRRNKESLCFKIGTRRRKESSVCMYKKDR